MKLPRIMIGLVAAVSLWQFGQAGVVHGKAWLGQWLLERAWQQSQDSGEPVAPWPGAVSHPVARLHVPRLDLDRLVLEGAETPVLAWGPGMETGPGGHRLLAAHRDTHFRFLERIETGDRFEMRYADGRVEHWRVRTTGVVDARDSALDMSLSAEVMTLVTCYPFNAATAGGPLRFVVGLEPASATETTGEI